MTQPGFSLPYNGFPLYSPTLTVRNALCNKVKCKVIAAINKLHLHLSMCTRQTSSFQAQLLRKERGRYGSAPLPLFRYLLSTLGKW